MMQSLKLRQLTGILRFELRACLFGRRALATYFLAFAPVGLILIWALFSGAGKSPELFDATTMGFGVLFHIYVSGSIFLATLILFMSLFRSEIMRRSLHYYFLTPVRREILVLGKYLAAMLTATGVFAVATLALYVLMLLPWGLGKLTNHLFEGPGLSHLVAYVGIAILACLGYGAIFLLAGLFLRNPVVAAVLIWGWEWINPILPAMLKKLSVVFYLRSLYPVPMPEEIFSVVADPISPWLSVPGLFLFTALVLVTASWRAKRMEIAYGDD